MILHITCFSPTGTSRAVAQAVAEGTGLTYGKAIDVTYTPLDSITTYTANDLLIISVPVYGGLVAPLALERLENLRGNQTPAVLLTVYGNRDFEKAPAQLAEFLTQRGFIPVAAGAFVGEHSYSTSTHPIAPGRPNTADLQEAKAFGQKVADKLKTGSCTPIDVTRMPRPRSGFFNMLGFILFVLRYRRQAKKHPVKIVPTTDADRCTTCGKCAKLCPTQAIDPLHPTETDPTRCIKCSACVKQCPRHARTLATPFGPKLSRYFKRQKPNITIS